MILCILVVSGVIFLFLFLILLIFFPLWVRLKVYQFIFSKEQLLVSLILLLFSSSLFHLFLLWSLWFHYFYQLWVLCVLLLLVVLGLRLGYLFEIFLASWGKLPLVVFHRFWIIVFWLFYLSSVFFFFFNVSSLISTMIH